MAGRNIKINMLNSSLPNMSDALNGWEVSIVADYISQVNINNEIVNIAQKQRIAGVLQPLRPEDVELKPEGQRSWSWFMLHVKPHYNKLRVEQQIEINKQPYKVMSVKDYQHYGYVEYHVIRSYHG